MAANKAGLPDIKKPRSPNRGFFMKKSVNTQPFYGQSVQELQA